MSILFIVSAPSGSGKSTLVNELFKMVQGLGFSGLLHDSPSARK